MIRIELKNAKDIEDWYAENVAKIIQGKIYSAGLGIKNKYAKEYRKELIKKTTQKDLLTMRIPELAAKYAWVKEYYEAACFACEFKDFQDYLKKHYKSLGHSYRRSRAEYQKERDKYWTRYSSNRIVNDFYKAGHYSKSICDSNTKMTKFVNAFGKYFDEINEDISKIVNYDFLDTKPGRGKKITYSIRAEYVKRLGIRVCPYCNQQYIYSFGDDRYLGDLDHIRPKSQFALFSMSMYNLVPACKPCNQLFKKSSTKQILNPYEEGFENDAYLRLKYKHVREIIGLDPVKNVDWRVNKHLKRYADKKKNELTYKKIVNEIELFGLDQVYKGHEEEIQTILKRRYDFDKRYRKYVKMLIGYSELSDPRVVYGISFDEDQYQNELMSKAISDIISKN